MGDVEFVTFAIPAGAEVYLGPIAHTSDGIVTAQRVPSWDDLGAVESVDVIHPLRSRGVTVWIGNDHHEFDSDVEARWFVHQLQVLRCGTCWGTGYLHDDRVYPDAESFMEALEAGWACPECAGEAQIVGGGAPAGNEGDGAVAVVATPPPTPIPDLMEALAESLERAKKARRDRLGEAHDG